MYFFDSDEDLQQAIVAIHHDYAVALECAARARRVSDTISWEVDSAKLVDFVSALCNTR